MYSNRILYTNGTAPFEGRYPDMKAAGNAARRLLRERLGIVSIETWWGFDQGLEGFRAKMLMTTRNADGATLTRQG